MYPKLVCWVRLYHVSKRLQYFLVDRNVSLNFPFEFVSIISRIMSANSTYLSSTHSGAKTKKRKAPEADEECKNLDAAKFWEKNQKFMLKLSENDETCMKTSPSSGKFFAAYVKQIRPLHDMLGLMNDLFNGDVHTFRPSLEIRRKFSNFTKQCKSQLDEISRELIDEVQKDGKVSGSPFQSPKMKLKKIVTENDDDEQCTKIVDNELDLNGSDIDLQLEDVLDDVYEIERKATASRDATPVKNSRDICSKSDSSNLRGLQCEPDGFVKVYVDGSCISNGRFCARAGIGVWFNDNHPLNVSERFRGVATNNNAEIHAAAFAINQAKTAGVKKLRIYTDSEFLINCITKWIKNWKINNWMTASKKPVANKEALVELEKAMATIEAVDWHHVRGHTGVYGNERADVLAKQGAEKY